MPERTYHYVITGQYTSPETGNLVALSQSGLVDWDTSRGRSEAHEVISARLARKAKVADPTDLAIICWSFEPNDLTGEPSS